VATRFYFPTDQAVPVAVVPSASWAIISEVNQGRAVTVRVGTGASASVASAATGTPGDNALVLLFVSDPLAAQTISGTVKGQFSIGQLDPDTDGYSQLILRVVSGDGATVRGVLLAAHAEPKSSEFWTQPGFRNRKMPLAAISPASLSSLAVSEGDRLVFEIGFKSAGTVADDCDFWYGDAQAIDLPEDETTSQSNRNPWIELSGAISFVGAAAPVASGHSSGIGIRLGL